MQFSELTEKEYNDFWVKHPLKTFLSASSIAKIRKLNNWNVVYLGVKDKNSLLAASMVFYRTKKLGKKEFYSPRGLLLDFENKELLKFFVEEIKKYVKDNNGYVFRVDPYINIRQRDIDGNVVEEGYDNSYIVDDMKNLGFIKVPLVKEEQASWMFSLDIENKTEEQILKEMKANTRNTIKKVEKIGVRIRELSYDELNDFRNIMLATSERKKFATRNLEYFETMYNEFYDKKEVRFIVSELDLDEYISRSTDELTSKQDKLDKIKDNKSSEGLQKELNNDINILTNRINEAKNIKETTGKSVITMSGAMFTMFDPEVTYLFGGNKEEYLSFNSQYLIQWEMIKYGIRNGHKKYNFYGIPANIADKPEGYGIYLFKKGFNGYVEELIGEFELPITWHYKLFKLISKFR